VSMENYEQSPVREESPDSQTCEGKKEFLVIKGRNAAAFGTEPRGSVGSNSLQMNYIFFSPPPSFSWKLCPSVLNASNRKQGRSEEEDNAKKRRAETLIVAKKSSL
jgi:hypothetical protein